MFDNPAMTLQLLSGRKLHVLIALIVLKDQLPVSELTVAEMVGCDRGTARRTMGQLMALGLVAREGRYQKRPWTLTAVAYQLPLPLYNNSDSEVRFSPHSPSSSSSYSYPNSTPLILDGEEEAQGEVSFAPHPLTLVDKSAHPVDNYSPYPIARDKGLLGLLEDSGVGRNMWDRLADLEWMTVDYLAAHLRVDDPVNFVIQRMLCGEVAPRVKCPRCSGLECICDRLKF